MPFPHSKSSWWYALRCFSFCCRHIFIPRHCTYCSAVCIFSILAKLPPARCSCDSFRACFCTHGAIHPLQSPEPTADTTASLLLFHFLFSFCTVRLSVAMLAVSAVVGVTAFPISIAIFIARPVGILCFLSTTPPVFMHSLNHTDFGCHHCKAFDSCGAMSVACLLVVTLPPISAKPFRQSI